MAVVDRHLKNRTIVYYVTNRLKTGAQVWEHLGTDKRKAERRDSAMKREIAENRYQGTPSSEMTVGTYADLFFPAITNRTAEDERGWWYNHVAKRCPWFLAIRLDDLDLGGAKHVIKLLAELRKPYESLQNQRKGKIVELGQKSIFNIYGVVQRLFRQARVEGLMRGNPCELPAELTPSNRARSKRKPYTGDEVVTLTTDERIRLDARMWIALAFYTGEREGEVCGHKFKDYDPGPSPLGSLLVERQYDGAMLKTSTIIRGEKPRIVPVHPTLAAMLDDWKERGFELVFCRKPTPEDFIVPCRAREARNHTRSSAYKMFQAACEVVEIESHTVHATRNTFISFCRRARCDVAALERVTHNSSGDVIDAYTDFDWESLCDAVSMFMTRPIPSPTAPRAKLHLVTGDPRQNVGARKSKVTSHTAKHG